MTWPPFDEVRPVGLDEASRLAGIPRDELAEMVAMADLAGLPPDCRPIALLGSDGLLFDPWWCRALASILGDSPEREGGGDAPP